MSETDKIKDFLLKNYPQECEKHKDESFSELVIEVIVSQDIQFDNLSQAYDELSEENKE